MIFDLLIEDQVEERHGTEAQEGRSPSRGVPAPARDEQNHHQDRRVRQELLFATMHSSGQAHEEYQGREDCVGNQRQIQGTPGSQRRGQAEGPGPHFRATHDRGTSGRSGQGPRRAAFGLSIQASAGLSRGSRPRPGRASRLLSGS